MPTCTGGARRVVLEQLSNRYGRRFETHWDFVRYAEEKGLPFEVRPVSLPDRDHHRPDYLRQSLTGRIPMLQHGDFTLSESSAIVEYLDDAFPGTPRALPTSVRERARAR